MELCQGIVQTVFLTLREATLLRKDASETLLSTEAAVEERLTLTYALHYLHRKHIGTKQLKLVTAKFMYFLQKLERLVIAHLLIGFVCHVVECLSLAVGILRGTRRIGPLSSLQ